MTRLLTVPQVAEYLQTSPEHVRRLIRTGRLRAVRVGQRALRVTEDDLWNLLKIKN